MKYRKPSDSRTKPVDQSLTPSGSHGWCGEGWWRVIKRTTEHWWGGVVTPYNQWLDVWPQLEFQPPFHIPPPWTVLSNENTGVRRQHQAGTNANMTFGEGGRGAPPVTVHLRLRGGYSSKSDSQLHHNCSYHDVVTLHLCLLIGQLVVLHFETLERERRNKLQVYGELCEICKHFSFTEHEATKWNQNRSHFLFVFSPGSQHSLLCSPHLWYWACRNWNSSLILSQDSATVNLKPGCPGWWGAWTVRG